jgi:hypothetical protein
MTASLGCTRLDVNPCKRRPGPSLLLAKAGGVNRAASPAEGKLPRGGSNMTPAAWIGLSLIGLAVLSFFGLMLANMAGKLDDYDERVRGIRRS